MMRLPVIATADSLAEVAMAVRGIEEDHELPEDGVVVRTLILMTTVMICLGVVVEVPSDLAITGGPQTREMILAAGGLQTQEAVGMTG